MPERVINIVNFIKRHNLEYPTETNNFEYHNPSRATIVLHPITDNQIINFQNHIIAGDLIKNSLRNLNVGALYSTIILALRSRLYSTVSHRFLVPFRFSSTSFAIKDDGYPYEQ